MREKHRHELISALSERDSRVDEQYAMNAEIRAVIQQLSLRSPSQVPSDE